MRTFWKKGIAVVFALMMAAAPLLGLAEEAMLSRYMSEALEQGLQLDTTADIRLGEGIRTLLPLLMMPEGSFEAIQKTLESLKITARLAKDPKGGNVIGMALSLQDTQLLTGDVQLLPTQLQMTTNLLPGKTLALSLEELGKIQQQIPMNLDAESQAALVKSAGTYIGIVLGWAMSNPGIMAESSDNIPQDAGRDVATSMKTIRLNGDQLKELLVKLAEAFEKDAELQGVLEKMAKTSSSGGSLAESAEKIAKKIKELKPAQGEVVVEIFTDAQGTPVECSLTMGKLFERMDVDFSSKYTRFTQDGTTYRLEAQLTAPGGQASVKVSYNDSWDKAANAHNLDLNAEFLIQEKDAETQQLTLTNKNTTVTDAAKETVNNAFALALESKSADGQESDSMFGSMTLELGSQSVTQGTGGKDFTSEQDITLSAMGMEILKLHLGIAPTAYVPEDLSANQLVDLSALSQEEGSKLLAEMQEEAGNILMTAVSLLPQELLSLLSEQ